jgi:hypothetical protein
MSKIAQLLCPNRCFLSSSQAVFELISRCEVEQTLLQLLQQTTPPPCQLLMYSRILMSHSTAVSNTNNISNQQQLVELRRASGSHVIRTQHSALARQLGSLSPHSFAEMIYAPVMILFSAGPHSPVAWATATSSRRMGLLCKWLASCHGAAFSDHAVEQMQHRTKSTTLTSSTMDLVDLLSLSL